MTKEERYNGWTNYETWCVHLWLSNEEGSYRYWREEAQRHLNEAPNHKNVERGVWTVDDASRYTLGEAMKESFETFHPFRGEHLTKPLPCDVFTDLLDAALSEVRWSEVAGAFLEEIEPDGTDEDKPEEGSDGEKAPLFELGRIVSTPRALQALDDEEMTYAISRHNRGDWGEVGQDDWQENETSLREGFRLLSVYRSTSGVTFWVITEADRSATTVLLPNEY